MSEYNISKPHDDLVAMKQTLAAMQEEFVDASGLPLDLGTPVRYTDAPKGWESETSPWTPERWGVVTGFLRRSFEDAEDEIMVQVTSVYVRDNVSSVWHNDQWYAHPSRLLVIA